MAIGLVVLGLDGAGYLLAVSNVDTNRGGDIAALHLDAAQARVDLVPVVVHAQDEVGAMATSFNTMQGQIAQAAAALDNAREDLRQARDELTASNAELARRSAELERRVEERTAALQAAHDELAALATTDPLTGSPNHRAMVAALDQELERARRYGRSCTVLFMDLEHFKALNDSHGHAAGDTTLRELAAVVCKALRGVDTLGRWGGEESIALLPETEDEAAAAAAERVRAAVAAHAFSAGGGAHVTCSIGLASYPHDAEERDRLVEMADRAMYAAKRLGRNQVRTAADPAVASLQATMGTASSREEMALAGTVGALAALVEARDHYTGEHTHEVATLVMRLALAPGLDATEAHMVGLAGRLHDVGKVAIPDAVLQKPARLSEDEWALMRTHPIVGAHVVSRVPALRVLTPLIRAHHERWDGQGYPDGLSGEAIPLGARLIAVADAYGAMTTDRPYRQGRDAAWALGELRRCSGTQFDPTVVAALQQVLAADPGASRGGACCLSRPAWSHRALRQRMAPAVSPRTRWRWISSPTTTGGCLQRYSGHCPPLHTPGTLLSVTLQAAHCACGWEEHPGVGVTHSVRCPAQRGASCCRAVLGAARAAGRYTPYASLRKYTSG